MKRLTAKQVHMKMGNLLTSVPAAVEYQTVAVFRKSKILGNLLGNSKQFTDQNFILRFDFINRRNYLVWNNKNMYLCLRGNIFECSYKIILIYNL